MGTRAVIYQFQACSLVDQLHTNLHELKLGRLNENCSQFSEIPIYWRQIYSCCLPWKLATFPSYETVIEPSANILNSQTCHFYQLFFGPHIYFFSIHCLEIFTFLFYPFLLTFEECGFFNTPYVFQSSIVGVLTKVTSVCALTKLQRVVIYYVVLLLRL